MNDVSFGMVIDISGFSYLVLSLISQGAMLEVTSKTIEGGVLCIDALFDRRWTDRAIVLSCFPVLSVWC